jgi:ribonuclease P protein component
VGAVWLRVCDAPSPDAPAVAYAVTRATGGAVDRNRVKRRLRAAVARHHGQLTAGTAYLFGGDHRVLHAPFATIDRAVGELVRAVGEVTSA